MTKKFKTITRAVIPAAGHVKDQSIYAHTFEGCRYDVGDKQGFLKDSVECALRRLDQREFKCN